MNEQQSKVTTGNQDSTVFPLYGKTPKSFSTPWKKWEDAAMINTVVSAAIILFIFGMVIYLTKDM